jgi:hypothetical protein
MSYLAEFEITQRLYPRCDAYLRILHSKRRVPVSRSHYFYCTESRILSFDLLQYFKRILVHLFSREVDLREKGDRAILKWIYVFWLFLLTLFNFLPRNLLFQNILLPPSHCTCFDLILGDWVLRVFVAGSHKLNYEDTI